MVQIVKIKSNKKATNKNGKEFFIHYYAIQHANGKLTPIKPMYDDGYARLELEAIKYEK